MKKKPKSNDEQKFTVIGTSSGLAVVHKPSELSKISEAVSNVIHSSNRVHIISDSKYKPKATKAKVKKTKSKVVKKKPATTPQPKAKTKPVLEVNWAASDDMRYAMWWDFHTNLSKGEYPEYRGIKITPIPISDQDKELIEQRTVDSRREKGKIQAIKACGITPRTELRNPLVGNAPHPSNKEMFEFGCKYHEEYRKELSHRYVELSSMTQHYALIGSTLPFQFVDHLDVIRGNSYVMTAQVTTSSMIDKLESIVEQDSKAQVIDQPTIETASVMNDIAQATANVFDIDVSKCMPFAANETVSDTSVPWVEEKQRMPKDILKYLHSRGKEPWPKGVDEVVKDYFRLEGTRYVQWLARRDSRWLRQRVEIARDKALPVYEMNLGEEVHPLYHIGEEVYNRMVSFHTSRRISLFDSGIISNGSFKNYLGSGAVHNKIYIKEVSHASDISESVSDAIDKHITQELADKLTERYVSRREGKTYGHWIRGIDSKYTSTTEATDEPSLTSPTPVATSDPDMSQALSTPTGDRSSEGAEIVSLSVVRDDRKKKLLDLRAVLSPKLSDLTPEQKDGARIVIEMMNEMLG